LFYFDPIIIDWEDYFMNIHIPGIFKYALKWCCMKSRSFIFSNWQLLLYMSYQLCLYFLVFKLNLCWLYYMLICNKLLNFIIIDQYIYIYICHMLILPNVLYFIFYLYIYYLIKNCQNTIITNLWAIAWLYYWVLCYSYSYHLL
jgi:hypothetical protein